MVGQRRRRQPPQAQQGHTREAALAATNTIVAFLAWTRPSVSLHHALAAGAGLLGGMLLGQKIGVQVGGFGAMLCMPMCFLDTSRRSIWVLCALFTALLLLGGLLRTILARRKESSCQDRAAPAFPAWDVIAVETAFFVLIVIPLLLR